MQELGKGHIPLRKKFKVENHNHHLNCLCLYFKYFVSTPVPSRPVYLSAEQRDSDIVLSWEEIPLANRRGFLLGYNVYVSNDSHLELIGT